MTAKPDSSVSLHSLSNGGHSVEVGSVGKDVGNYEGPVAARIRSLGDDRTPVNGRSEIGGREHDVGVDRETLELQLHFLVSKAQGVQWI